MPKITQKILIVGTVFLVIWLATIFWEFHGLHNFDNTVGRFFNSWLNKSEAFDLTLIFFSLDPGVFFVSGFFAVTIFAICRRKRHTRPQSIPFYFLYLGLVAAVAAFSVELVDHYVRRPGPAEAIAGFLNPGTLLEVSFRLPERTQFPSVETAIFSAVMFVVLFRFGSRALFLAPALVLMAVADIATGHAWVSDVMSGILLGWLVASTIYMMRANELYDRVEEPMVVRLDRFQRDASLAFFAWIKSRKSRRRVPIWKAPEINTPEKEEAISPKEFNLEEITRHWGLEDPRLIAPPHKGKLFPVRSGEKLYAFKITRRNIEKYQELARLLEMVHSLREAAGVNLCPILPALSGDLLVTSGEKTCYLMEWVKGRPLDVGKDDELRKSFALLGRLHAATLESLPHDQITERLNREVARLGTLYRESPERTGWFGVLAPDNAEKRDQNVFLEAQMKAQFVARLALFFALEDKSPLDIVLRHNDNHPMNYLVQEDGEILLLDFDRMRPGLAAMDLVELLQKFARRVGWDADRAASILDAYLEIRPMARWELALSLSWLLLPRPLLQALENNIHREDANEPPEPPLQSKLSWNLRYAAEIEAQEAFVAELAGRYGLPLLGAALGVTDQKPAEPPAANPTV